MAASIYPPPVAPVSGAPVFSDRLAFDVALTLESSGFSLDEVLTQHNLSKDEFIKLSANPLFLKKVGDYREEIKTKGLTFRFKARAQAEELLTTSWNLIHDPDTAPSVKADLIKSTVKWAGLEPRGEAPEGGSGGGVQILINLGGQTASLTSQPIEAAYVELPADANESVD